LHEGPLDAHHRRVDTLTIVARIASAVAAGAILGINRDLRHKPAGLRTHALVSLGSAMVVLVAVSSGANADGISRVVQGLITGIGFLGAGVIIHHEANRRVQGLTTAASVWVAAGLGAACGLGLTTLVLVAVGAALLVLITGGPIERAIERLVYRFEGGEALSDEERTSRRAPETRPADRTSP